MSYKFILITILVVSSVNLSSASSDFQLILDYDITENNETAIIKLESVVTDQSSPSSFVPLLYDIYYQNGSLWFSYADITDINGFSWLEFNVTSSLRGSILLANVFGNSLQESINGSIEIKIPQIIITSTPPIPPEPSLDPLILLMYLIILVSLIFTIHIILVNRRFRNNPDLESTYIPNKILKKKSSYFEGINVFKRVTWAFIVYKIYMRSIIKKDEGIDKFATKSKTNAIVSDPEIIRLDGVGEVRNCCYQTARIGEGYCICGRAISVELKDYISSLNK